MVGEGGRATRSEELDDLAGGGHRIGPKQVNEQVYAQSIRL
jgi:hypothetical protein